ncbi:MAG: PIN domain-containing protein [Alphaproteobacteria bacterium]|nr:PIN domain-containing protein [Alphaproteobacteria bacterium]
MAQYTALYDACVLYPAPLRDLLLQLATTDLFRARWTDTIHDEWIKNVCANRADLKMSDLKRTRELMDQNVRDCLVTGYEPLIDTLSLPDKNDRHVLAAAIQGRADVIVTFNLKDFPKESLLPYNIEAQHPDEFIAHLCDLAPTFVYTAAKTVRARLKNPPKTVAEYLAILEKQGLSKTADLLSDGKELI